MKYLLGLGIILSLSLFSSACGRSGDDKDNEFGNDTSVNDADLTSVPPETTNPNPTPTVPNINYGQQWTQVPQNPTYSSQPQDQSFSQYNGWPWNNGYQQSQNSQWSQYPQNYQSGAYAYFPDYHYNFQRAGYYSATIVALYRGILGRNPDYPGLEFWLRELIAGRPYTNIRESFLASQEAMALQAVDHQQNVIALYRVLLGRLPEREGLNFWVSQLKAGVPLTQVAQGFSNSQEYYQYGYGRLYSRSVVDLYKAYLGRIPEYQGLYGWLTQIASGNPYTGVVQGIKGSTEATQKGGDTATNCIAIHRAIRGQLPSSQELARCVAMGANSQVTAPNYYNSVAQQYAQSLIYSYNHCGGSPYCPY